MHQDILFTRTSDELKIKVLLTANPSRYSKLCPISSALGISESTLARRLARSGLRFQQIKDNWRMTLAKGYLQYTKLDMESIAINVGYSDAACFRRAFKNIIGISPSTYRNNTSCASSLH